MGIARGLNEMQEASVRHDSTPPPVKDFFFFEVIKPHSPRKVRFSSSLFSSPLFKVIPTTPPPIRPITYTHPLFLFFFLSSSFLLLSSLFSFLPSLINHTLLSPLSTYTMADNHDDEQHNVQFEGTSSGASLTFPMQCSALRKNGHVVIKGRPCKIVDMSTSKTGKHGHAKVHLVAIDIFTGKKLEDLSPSTHNMDVPNIKRVEFTLVNIDDGFLNLLDADSNQKDDVKVPEGELGQKMEADFDDGKDLLVTVIASMGEEAAISYKEAPKTD